jgi:hypothetical protein
VASKAKEITEARCKEAKKKKKTGKNLMRSTLSSRQDLSRLSSMNPNLIQLHSPLIKRLWKG